MRYVVFDVETPNSLNDRMSSIGIDVVENGEITEEFYTLVNPEERFDSFNIYLTGIKPGDAASGPDFPELWKTIEPVMGSGVLVAHNAPFDMRVLAKCLRSYNIEWRERTNYACTCRIGRYVFPFLPDHKLDTICMHLGLKLNHHHAGSDSRACGEILRYYLRSGVDVESYIRGYDLRAMKTVKPCECMTQ